MEAQGLKAVTEAQKWQERAQNLEKMIWESPNKREEYLGTQESFLTENAELKKQVEFLVERNAELEKVNKKETALLEIDKYEAVSMPESPEIFNDDLTAALELTNEQMNRTLTEFGLQGWKADGYHAKNNRVYPGYFGLKVFLDENPSNNRQMARAIGSIRSSSSFLEYSGKVATPA